MTTEGVQRKMAAILCADVEGYTRLMQDDPEATLLTLKEYRAVFKHCSESLNGRIVDSPGDNILIEFPMTVDAVQCAVEIQRKLIEKNTELSENRRMQFRIGIDSGDLLEEDGSLYGDGVNISARLQSLAESGGICISGRAHDQVVNRLPLKFEFLGKRSVKNISNPIRVYRVLIQPEAVRAVVKEGKAIFGTWQKVSLYFAAIIILGAVAVWYFSFSQAPVNTEMTGPVAEHAATAPEVKEAPKTIAVLLFDNVSSDPEQDYFAYGLSEEILNSLCQIPGLGVTGKTSSFYFKGKGKSFQEIANELGVDHILEGSVRKAGNALRITAQLIRASDGLHLWSETYDRELKDIFKIQEDIANSVADKLKLTLEAFNLVGGTDNLEAYELYLVAQGQKYDKEGGLSLKSIDEALAIDPEFALAWARKSFFHTESIKGYLDEHRESKLNAAIDAANRAIELEPNLADGFFQLGWIKTLTGDWIGAELAYGKALGLATEPFPEFAAYPLHYFAAGHFKKASEFLYAFRQKNPLIEPMRGFYVLNLGITGDIQGAEEECARCEALFGKFLGSTHLLMLQTGTWNSESKEEIRNLLSSRIISIEGIDFTSPEGSLSALRKYYNENPTTWGLVHVSWLAAYFGDPEFALEALKKENEVSAVDFIYFWLPAMQEVRQLPRFKEFVREIGLVDYWEQFDWPDLCHPTDDGDFVCD